MKLVIEKSVTVITPTIGTDSLKKCIDSVSKQDYTNITHLIVSDGREFLDTVYEQCDGMSGNLEITYCPYNTGQGGFYGHRVYAAYSHLVNTDYICYLDEDNWIEPNHISSLVNLIEEENLSWAHSLRKVYLENDVFLADDCCESIGRWPIWFTNNEHLVDTSSYCFRQDFIKNFASLWHSNWGGDRRFFMTVKDQARYNTTGLHTLNYRLPDMTRAYGGNLDFFKTGNEEIKKKYGGNYPWKKT